MPGKSAGESRSTLVLRHLTEEEGMTSAQLAHKLGLIPGLSVVRAQTKINIVLHRLEAAGWTQRDGTVYWQQDGQRKLQPSIFWRVTAAGREECARAQRATSRVAARTAVRAIRQASALAALDTAARLYGAGTSAGLRELVIAELRAHYCSLQAIGDVFGLSRERVRQILAENGKA